MFKKIIILLLGVLGFGPYVQSQDVQNGVLDLRGVDLNQTVVKTEGYWEFYWKKFLDPKQLTPARPEQNVQYVYVPAFNPKTPDKTSFPKYGFATYRLTIFLDTNATHLMFRIPFALTAERIFVNGRLLTQIGKPDSLPQNYVAKVGNQLIQVYPRRYKDFSVIDLVVHVADYKTVSFGLKQPFIIAQAPRLGNWILFSSIIYAVILSIMLYIAVSNFFISFFRGSQIKMNITFGFLTLGIVVRSFIENQVYLPVISYELFAKVAYGAPAIYPALLLVFLYYAYPNLFNRRFVIFASGFSGLMFLFVLLTPTVLFTKLLLKLIPIYVLFVISYVTVKVNRKFITGQWQLLLPSIGLIILFFCNIHDSLKALGIIRGQYITYLGLFAYVIAQQMAKTIEYIQIFKENARLTKELENRNIYLEQEIAKRTQTIEQQKKQLLERNEELRKINEAIKAQKEKIEHQNLQIERQNRHLKSSIEYAFSIQKAILPTEEEIAQYFDNFILYMPKEIVSGDFYFFLPVKNQGQTCYFVAVVDCTGHGIPGAFMSLISYMILNKIILADNNREPQQILRQANREVISLLHQKSNRNIDGFDIALIKIIPPQQNEKFKIIFAGARLPVFYKDKYAKEVSRIRGASKSIGGHLFQNIQQEPSFQQVAFYLSKGSMVWLLSDGLIDQVNPQHHRFGSLKLMTILKQVAELDLKTQKRIIQQAFFDWKQYEQQRDDITVLGIRL